MLLLLTFWWCPLSFGNSQPTFPSEWDRKLPSLVLENVKLSGPPSNVWSVLSYDYGARSVFVHDSATTSPVIQIDETTITVSALYDRVAEQCDYKWHTDGELGITWFFPDRFEYEDLLNSQVSLDANSTVGLLVSDVLFPLSEKRQLGVGPFYSSLLARSVNHPVELPAGGKVTARDLINFISASRVTQGFFIYLDGSNIPQITPLNLSFHPGPVARPGERLLGELELQTSEPLADLIFDLLATGNNRQVHFAEQFLQLSGSRFPSDTLLRREPDGARRTALAVAASRIHIQSAGGSLPEEMIAPILDAASDEELLRENPGLYLRAAIEVFRLTGSIEGLDRFAEVPGSTEMLQSMADRVEHAFRGLGVLDLEFESVEATDDGAGLTTESASPVLTESAAVKSTSPYGLERRELFAIAADVSGVTSARVVAFRELLVELAGGSKGRGTAKAPGTRE